MGASSFQHLRGEANLKALVLSGSNNVYACRLENGSVLECRLKGKVLKGCENYYNPLAPGDYVEVDDSSSDAGMGMIHSLVDRRNAFSRWNQKGKAPQLLAANLDLVACLATPAMPPFRPRFLDRLLLQADRAGIPALILLNKRDLDSGDPDTAERLEDYRRIGFDVCLVSARTGEGLPELRLLLDGKTAALIGQSGVGKSSLLNALDPGLKLKTSDVSLKYDRGTHTTTMGRLLDIQCGSQSAHIVDTPGIRCFVPDGIRAADLTLYMREFSALAGTCTYGHSCSHVTEAGCKILEAVNAGAIHEDRYESFLRIRDDLADLVPYWEK